MEHTKSQEVQVVGLGQACVDHLGIAPYFPGEDEKMALSDLHLQCGGPASTALITLARLGITTSFIGSISNDSFGQKILKNLCACGVDTSRLKITPGYTSQYAFIAITEATGKRTIFWHPGTVPHLTTQDIDLSAFTSARILHVDSLMVEACIEAAKKARHMGMLVVMDAGTLRERTLDLVSLVDVVIASESFAASLDKGIGLSIEHTLEQLARLGPDQVIITQGEKGSVGLHNGKLVTQQAFQVRARDTTGAGDVYHGAYIYGMLNNWSMERCMQFASAVAALKCLGIGAQAGIPDLSTVKHFMTSAGCRW
jgi:ribokinase